MIFILFCVMLPALISVGVSLLICEIEIDKGKEKREK